MLGEAMAYNTPVIKNRVIREVQADLQRKMINKK